MSSFEAAGKTEADLEGCIICICSGTDLVNLNFMFMVAENPDTARVGMAEDVKVPRDRDGVLTLSLNLMSFQVHFRMF